MQPGDAVYGTSDGSFAEYVAAKVEKVAHKPRNLSFEDAAAVPVSAVAALQAVRDEAHLEPGQRSLVIGASGGVGSFIVQLVKAYGGSVTGVASTSKLDLVRQLGADEVIDYTEEDFADGHRTYDVVFDTGGNRPLSQVRRALARGPDVPGCSVAGRLGASTGPDPRPGRPTACRTGPELWPGRRPRGRAARRFPSAQGYPIRGVDEA